MAKMTEEELEIFEERAAIMEYDGGLSRERAEEEARKSIEKRRIIILGAARQTVHPNGTTRYYDDPNTEDVIGVAGEKAFADRYGLKIDETLRPEGDGHIDFTLEKSGQTLTIDVKTAIKAYNLLVKEWEIDVCADIFVLGRYNDDGIVTFLGWETKEIMKTMPLKVFSSLNIKNYYRHSSKLRPMAELDIYLKEWR